MKEYKTMEEVVAHLSVKYLKGHPCTEEEVQKIENFYSLRLPNSYRKFLLNFGKGLDGYMEGHDYTYEFLLKMRNSANNLLANSKSLKLKEDDFVFWMHQGYQFCFFNANDGENPPVFYFNEFLKKQDFIKLSENISGFIYSFPEIMNQQLDENLFW